MNGVLNVYKEQGFTSHDVVAKLRGILKTKKIGHTGTLDPDAVGVLPVCIGKATKLCDLITDWGKTYEAVMLLGTTTDTLDISGKIVAQSEVNVSEVDVLKACNEFIGEYEQIPPMYSALKYNGQKLYELARKGIEIERKPRTVHINTLRVNDINLSDKQKTVTITVDCSKGTYIRSLCDDIGKKLGCGACMMKLTRTRVGKFMLDDTLTLNQISALVLKGEIEDRITCIDKIFSDYQEITFAEEYSRYLHNGNKMSGEQIPADAAISDNEKYRVYDSDKCFIGVYEFQDEVLYPVKIFYEDLKLKVKRMMAVLDPVKLVIDNYPEGQVEYMEVANNQENPEMGTRKVPFTKELYIEREDFMEEPPKKYFRLFPGNEVRLMNAYFVTCTDYVKDENGKVIEVHCTYDPETRGGNFTGRKVKGTIHWVSATEGCKAEVRLYENIVDEEKGVYNEEDGSMNINPNSKIVLTECYLEPELMKAVSEDKFQFVRNGYFCVDNKDSEQGKPIFNRIVSLKSSFKLQK